MIVFSQLQGIKLLLGHTPCSQNFAKTWMAINDWWLQCLCLLHSFSCSPKLAVSFLHQALYRDEHTLLMLLAWRGILKSHQQQCQLPWGVIPLRLPVSLFVMHAPNCNVSWANSSLKGVLISDWALQIVERTCEGNYTIPDNPSVSPWCKDFLQRCLTVDPGQRITVRDIYDHLWFKLNFPESVPLSSHCQQHFMPKSIWVSFFVIMANTSHVCDLQWPTKHIILQPPAAPCQVVAGIASLSLALSPWTLFHFVWPCGISAFLCRPERWTINVWALSLKLSSHREGDMTSNISSRLPVNQFMRRVNCSLDCKILVLH